MIDKLALINIITDKTPADFSDALLSISGDLGSYDIKKLLEDLADTQLQFRTFAKEEVRESGTKLIDALMTQYYYPRALDSQFDLAYVNLLFLARLVGYKFKKTADDKKIADRLEYVFKNEENHLQKFYVALLLYTAECIAGQDKKAERDYLRRISKLDPQRVLGNNVLIYFKKVTKMLFPDLESLVDNYIDANFKGSYWNRNPEEKVYAMQWMVPAMWEVYGYSQAFMKLYKNWLGIFRKAIGKDDRSLVFYLHFPLSHAYLNLTQTQEEWRVFNEEVEIPLAEYIKKIAAEEGIEKRDYPLDKSKPLRIGFVYDRVVMNSLYKVFFSFLITLKEFNNDGHEIFVYDLEYIDKTKSSKECVRNIELTGAKYVSNHALIDDYGKGLMYDHYNKSKVLRERVVQDEIDVLIAGNSREQISYLLATRTAPLQIFWSHGNFIFDIEGIDGRISHIHAPEPGKTSVVTAGYEFEYFPVKTAEFFHRPPVDRKAIEAARAKYPADAVILGSIGRMVKLESREYLDAVAAVMKEHPNSIYIACGDGYTADICKVLDEHGIRDRFYFPGMINPHIYGYVIDIYLNTFPQSGGESLNEFISKGGAFVQLQSREVSEKSTQETVIAYKDLIEANRETMTHNGEDLLYYYINREIWTIEGYIKSASDLVGDSELRRKVAATVNLIFNESHRRKEHSSYRLFMDSVYRIMDASETPGS